MQGVKVQTSIRAMYMYNDKAATTATRGVKPLAPNIASCMLVPEHVTVAKIL